MRIKRLFAVLILMLLAGLISACSPEQFGFSGLARGSNGEPIVVVNVCADGFTRVYVKEYRDERDQNAIGELRGQGTVQKWGVFSVNLGSPPEGWQVTGGPLPLTDGDVLLVAGSRESSVDGITTPVTVPVSEFLSLAPGEVLSWRPHEPDAVVRVSESEFTSWDCAR